MIPQKRPLGLAAQLAAPADGNLPGVWPPERLRSLSTPKTVNPGDSIVGLVRARLPAGWPYPLRRSIQRLGLVQARLSDCSRIQRHDTPLPSAWQCDRKASPLPQDNAWSTLPYGPRVFSRWTKCHTARVSTLRQRRPSVRRERSLAACAPVPVRPAPCRFMPPGQRSHIGIGLGRQIQDCPSPRLSRRRCGASRNSRTGCEALREL